MSQNTLKVHDLNEDAEFDENGVGNGANLLI